MNIEELIKKRRSIRKFKKGIIPGKDLKLIMQAAQLAPSASNRQPYQFLIVEDQELREKLGNFASGQIFISKASIIIVGLGNIKREKWYKVDLAIAYQQIILQATELGYGSIWIGSFEEEKIKKLLKIPENLEIVALLPIGIADQEPPARPRKSASELFFLNIYGDPLGFDLD